MNRAIGKSDGGFRELRVYKLAYRMAMEIFRRSRIFPDEERYSLTSQIRRSSRSVAANIAEGYRKRQYSAMFSSKLADADAEATETGVWLDFARDCGYITPETHSELAAAYDEIGRMLHVMIAAPGKFVPRSAVVTTKPENYNDSKASASPSLNIRE
ncbi:MAG: four helix bundle protein [Candidatus Acidiferrales bacterium]